MHKEKTFLAIIPARGGSKRLPGKNILDLNGKTLVTWSIEAGLKSKYIDEVVVTSDNTEILNISQNAGAVVIERPAELATDTSTTFDSIRHTIENSKNHDYIVLLQPTSPLRTKGYIDKAIELLIRKEADAVVSVCEMEHSPLWANTLPNNKSMDNFIKDKMGEKRSQDLDKYYRVNGAIYICSVDRFIQEKTLFIKDNIYAYEMNRSASIDIDERIDFEWAEFLLLKSQCK